jgi:hypothetical protein
MESAQTKAVPFINVTVDATDLVAELGDVRQKDIPFATALALTRTAQDGAIEERRREAQVFKLRNNWTQQNTKAQPAEKASWPITSAVYTDTANSSTGAPDYLLPQEEGGEKVPFGGHAHIAIPTKYLRKYAPGAIPQSMRPKNLLPAGAELGRAYRVNVAAAPGARKFQGISRSGARALGSTNAAAFVQVDRRGTLCIFVRSTEQKHDAEPWYILVPEATIRARLGMAETVAQVADQRFEQHWEDAWSSIRL